jgi:hypothetical protein
MDLENLVTASIFSISSSSLDDSEDVEGAGEGDILYFIFSKLISQKSNLLIIKVERKAGLLTIKGARVF